MGPAPSPATRPRVSRSLRGAMEVVLLALVCLSPWAYGAVHPGFLVLLYAGVAVLPVLRGLRVLVEGQVTWQKCPVARAWRACSWPPACR
jgi:hypothetical protein